VSTPKPASPFVLRAEERAPLAVLVSRQLRQAIVSGKVSIGAELPSEKELTHELGVGRSTVREALRILKAQGLVSGGETVSTRRPRVSTGEALSRAAAQAMDNVVRLAQVPLGDLVELRIVIEGAGVELAARAADGALDEARAAIAAMKAPAVDLDAFRAADLRFHRTLANAAGNAAFPLVMGVLRSAIGAHLGEALAREPDPRKAMKKLTREHEAILEAVAGGDGALARALVTRHIRAFYRGREVA
jgi:DNA-binding FadR family transcriptional regulator